MIHVCAEEFIQRSAEFTIGFAIESARDRTEMANRAKFAHSLVEKLGSIGDVYWSSDGSLETEPDSKPVFAVTISDRKRWTSLSLRALRRGFNNQIHAWTYRLDLTSEFAIDRFLFAIEDAFPQFAKEARR